MGHQPVHSARHQHWILSIACAAILAVMSSGCCGPIGCGVGCGTGDICDHCEGVEEPGIVYRPLDGLRHLKRTITCGSGCGETYVGEWISTPPHSSDPCCGDQFVGGASHCQPFCWQPGTLLSNLYGVRFCDDCGDDWDSCDCGDCDHNGGVVKEAKAKVAHKNCKCASCMTAHRSFGNRAPAREFGSTVPERVTRTATDHAVRLR